MKKLDLILAVLSTGNDFKYTPVQIQKVFFLVDNLLGDKIGGPFFKFVPYHYGPFDKEIYNDLKQLSDNDFVQISKNPLNSLQKFGLTSKGIQKGIEELNKLSNKDIENVNRISAYVRELTFSQLVSSIYKAFPEMKKNSIFNE